MRRTYLSIALAVCFTNSSAQSWELVATDNEDTNYYIDVDSLRVIEHGGTSTWMRTEYNKPRNMGGFKGIKEALSLTDFMCGSRAYTSRDYVMRNAKGNVVTSGQDFTRHAVVPGSIGGALYDRVCPSR